MNINKSGFIFCSFCGSDLQVQGKKGLFLQTKCNECGMSSDDLEESLQTYQELDKKKVEVYYSQRASV